MARTATTGVLYHSESCATRFRFLPGHSVFLEQLLETAIFRRLGEASPAVLAVFNAQLDFEWVNRSWMRDLGWSAAELLGRRLDDLVHPDDVAGFRMSLASAATISPTTTARTRFRHRDESWRWIDWFVAPMEEGLFYAREITAVVEAAQSLDRQLRLMTLAEEIAGVGHWSLDLEAGRVHWSPQVFRIYGRDPALGMPSLDEAIDAYHPDDRPRVESTIADAMATGAPFEFELRLIRADGLVRKVIARGNCEVEPISGRVTVLFGTFLDVTERDQARDHAAREHRLVTTGMLAAGVGHEMNNPLAFISANLEAMAGELAALGGAATPARLRTLQEMLTDARAGTERLKHIVRGIRAFAQDDSPPVPTALQRVVDLSIGMSMHEVRLRATCVAELDAVPLVDADEARLSQVLVNLIVNAAQAFPVASPTRNRIVIRARTVGDATIELSVSDNGPGMSDAVLARIFEPFFTTKPVGEGTGLGLAISHSLIASFGGELLCESVPGQGTTFRIRLRASSVRPVDPPPSVPVDAVPLLSRRIVVIDDEEALVRVISRFLGREAVVAGFTDAPSALRYLRQAEHVDLVLCDLMMPHLTGMALHEAVQAFDPALAARFVFMSGGATQDELRTFLASVENERLDKPFDLHQLRALVHRLLAAHPAP